MGQNWGRTLSERPGIHRKPCHLQDSFVRETYETRNLGLNKHKQIANINYFVCIFIYLFLECKLSGKVYFSGAFWNFLIFFVVFKEHFIYLRNSYSYAFLDFLLDKQQTLNYIRNINKNNIYVIYNIIIYHICSYIYE